MAADPIVYCLEQLTDYAQFERLCHDLMSLEGYRNIEPLGGTKDKGRDAIHINASDGAVSIFAYSVREDWQKKLTEDSDKVVTNKHNCTRLVFLTTASFTAMERDKAVEHVRKTYRWTLELYGIERLRTMLATNHQSVIAHHPQIFCPPFFPVAGGLSLSPSPDHIVIDHVEADAALAHWLARRMMLAGYQVWCRGLAPLAGSSVTETIRGLLNSRAFRYVSVLSHAAMADTEFTARRHMAQAIGSSRGSQLLIPARASGIDPTMLDAETRGLTAADFTTSWDTGLKSIIAALGAAQSPRHKLGSIDLAIRSYFPLDITLPEPETLASNLFKVTKVPSVIRRFYSKNPIDDICEDVQTLWAFRKVGPTHFLSFHYPPPELSKQLDIVDKGGAVWNAVRDIDGIPVSDMLVELLKKSVQAEARRRGLLYCTDRHLIYFPFKLLKNDHLSFRRLDGKATFFSVAGERTQGKGVHARKYRYHIAPGFACRAPGDGEYEIIVRIRLRLTDSQGQLFHKRTAHARRKNICKSWWNDEWLARTMGVMQFLADGESTITLGPSESDRMIVSSQPRTWSIPIRLNESALAEATQIREEEDVHLRADDEHDEADDE